jgi:hypothetical protein
MSPRHFVSEVAHFRVLLGDPALPNPDKARVWGAIVQHAAKLDPHEEGFEQAGVALKEALCQWLELRSSRTAH